jgi:chaperonin GroEL (HSP60 family)
MGEVAPGGRPLSKCPHAVNWRTAGRKLAQYSVQTDQAAKAQSTRFCSARAAQNGEYVNLVSKGIFAPTKVVWAALQNAASIAGLLITIEAMVAERPKKDSGAPAMPGGGRGSMDY